MANISIYDPRTMGKLVERMPKVQTFIKSTFFRNVETFDTQKIDVDSKKGNRQLAHSFIKRLVALLSTMRDTKQTPTSHRL